MHRTVLGNDPHTFTLEVEWRDWEEVVDMIEATQVIRKETPDGSHLTHALRLAQQFLIAYQGELQLRATGETHIISAS